MDHLRDINLTIDTMDFQKLAGKYKSELLDSVLPFWLEHSQDKQYGGYFTCLERDGSVYDTDKFIWLQGREVWLFSMLYNKVEKRPEWLECALQGAEFLKKYGHDGNYNWYFSLTRDGRPLVDPYNIFSYTFATMAFAQLAIASGDAGYAAIAKKTFDRVLEKRSNPKGKWCKAHPGTRPIKDFALPMILCNLSLEIEQLIDRELIDETIETCLHEVMEVFYQKDLGLIVENVSAEDNSLVDSFEGRSINPGHSLEAMWFIMDLGQAARPPRFDREGRGDRACDYRIRLGQTVRRHILFHGSSRASAAAARMGSETVVGAYRIRDHDDQGLPADGQQGVPCVVPETARLHVDALQRPEISRVVRLPQPPRGGAPPAQGRQVEGVFPCSARTLPDMADPRTMQIGGSFPMPDKRFAGLKRCRDI